MGELGQAATSAADDIAQRAEELREKREAGARKMTEAMDLDGDGVITAEEVAAYARDVAASEVAGALKRDRLWRWGPGLLRCCCGFPSSRGCMPVLSSLLLRVGMVCAPWKASTPARARCASSR